MKTGIPYLNFDGNAEEAFNFYKSVFGGELHGIARYSDFGEMPGMPPLSDADKNKIAHVSMPLGSEGMLMGSDLVEAFGQKVTVGNNFNIHLIAESREEAETIFAGLCDGGTALMPLQKTEWAEVYGSCIDRFGVTWGVDYAGSVQYELPQG